MYCIRCGAENPDDAAFCRKCGSTVEPHPPTLPAPPHTGASEPGLPTEEPSPTSRRRPWVRLGTVIMALGAVVVISGLAYIGVEQLTTDGDEPPLSQDEYANAMIIHSTRVVGVLENVGALGQIAAGNPLVSESWHEELSRQQEELNDIESDVMAIDPPSGFEEVHMLFLQALNEVDTGLQLMGSGTSNLDPDEIEEAGSHIEEATRIMGEAVDAIPATE